MNLEKSMMSQELMFQSALFFCPEFKPPGIDWPLSPQRQHRSWSLAVNSLMK